MLFNNKLFNSIACLLSFTNLQLVIPGRTWILLYLGRTVYKRLWACLALYYDDVWDNGLPLGDPRCLDPKVYEKQGILGFMLENIRHELNNTPLPCQELAHMDVTANDSSIISGNHS